MPKGNHKSNYPAAQEINAQPAEIGNKVATLNELRKLPPVHKNEPEEVQERLSYYFKYCEENGLKPSVEGMTLALGVSRTGIWLWEQDGCEAGKIVSRAKQLINALLVDFTVNGKLAFPYSIWLQKNHFGYSDNRQIELIAKKEDVPQKTPDELLEDAGLVWDDEAQDYIEKGS